MGLFQREELLNCNQKKAHAANVLVVTHQKQNKLFMSPFCGPNKLERKQD